MEILLGEKPLDSEISKAENEVLNDYRDFIFNDGKEEIHFRVFNPSNREQAYIADQTSKKYTEMLLAGDFLLWEDMVLQLKKRGVWTEEDESRVEYITDDIKYIVKAYLKLVEDKSHDKELANKLKEDYFKCKEEINKHIEKKNQFYTHTIDNKSNEHGVKYKLLYCLYHKVGEEYVPYFKNIDEVEDMRSRVISRKILQECLTFWAGLSQELLSVAPEDDLLFGGNGLPTLLENSDGQ